MNHRAIGIACTCFTLAAIGCGGTPESAAPEGNSSGENSDGMLTVTTVVKNESGEYEATTVKVTPAEMQQMKAMRDEHKRQALAGVKVAAIGRGSCMNDDSLWLYSGGGFTGSLCCVIGAGNQFVQYMCPYSLFYSMYPGNAGGLYGSTLHSCGEEFYPWTEWPSLNCDESNWVQLDF